MRRYEEVWEEPGNCAGMEPHPTGVWVRYDDVAALVEAAFLAGADTGWLRDRRPPEMREAAQEYTRAALAGKEEIDD